MVRLSQLRDHGKTRVTIALDGIDPIELDVYPNRLTVGLQKRIQTAGSDNDSDAMTRAFFEVVDEWNVTNDDGQILPKTSDTIDQLGLPVVGLIIQRVTEAVSPNPGTSTS